ncbi:hypothetical protein LTR94_030432, partial [Friedmanniomyces endolithicus]
MRPDIPHEKPGEQGQQHRSADDERTLLHRAQRGQIELRMAQHRAHKHKIGEHQRFAQHGLLGIGNDREQGHQRQRQDGRGEGVAADAEEQPEAAGDQQHEQHHAGGAAQGPARTGASPGTNQPVQHQRGGDKPWKQQKRARHSPSIERPRGQGGRSGDALAIPEGNVMGG